MSQIPSEKRERGYTCYWELQAVSDGRRVETMAMTSWHIPDNNDGGFFRDIDSILISYNVYIVR